MLSLVVFCFASFIWAFCGLAFVLFADFLGFRCQVCFLGKNMANESGVNEVNVCLS